MCLTRTALLLLACATVLVPLLLQATGVVPPFYAFDNGAIQILPFAFDFPPGLTWIILLGGTLLTIGTANGCFPRLPRAALRQLRPERSPV